MQHAVSPQYSPQRLGLLLEDLIGDGNADQLRETLRSNSVIFVDEICKEFHQQVYGDVSPSLHKRLRVKRVMDEIIIDLRDTTDTFNARANAARIVVKPFVAFLVELYCEPR